MWTMCSRWWSVFPLAILLLVGCSGSSAERPVKVKGTVTLDQKPLAEGDIVFRTPGAAPNLIPITNGSFEGEVTPGKKIVEIRAYKPQPPPPPMPGVTFEPGKINYIPAQYNDASKIEKEVTPGGPNEFKFEVTSK
jgi:hypothetical protein